MICVFRAFLTHLFGRIHLVEDIHQILEQGISSSHHVRIGRTARSMILLGFCFHRNHSLGNAVEYTHIDIHHANQSENIIMMRTKRSRTVQKMGGWIQSAATSFDNDTKTGRE